MIDFSKRNGWYKNSFSKILFKNSFGESVAESVAKCRSAPGRPILLTWPWPANIPCQLRSPKDIINPKIIIFWEKIMQCSGMLSDSRQYFLSFSKMLATFHKMPSNADSKMSKFIVKNQKFECFNIHFRKKV